MSQHDNLEEYQNPEEYDLEYGKYGRSGAFYESLAREVGGPILELACGTGRVAIPLAEMGFAVTGLDLSAGMLAQAARKTEGSGLPVRWVEGDCCTFQLGEQFHLIYMTGHAFQAFLDRPAQEAMLARVREHLRPGGLFAFEARNPRLAELAAGNGQEEFWHNYHDPAGNLVRVSGTCTYDPVRQVEHCVTYRRRTDAAGRELTHTTRIDLRYTFPQELESLLHYNGFKVLRRYGDFDLSPLTGFSPEIVCVCQQR